jgi:hypothetical protein
LTNIQKVFCAGGRKIARKDRKVKIVKYLFSLTQGGEKGNGDSSMEPIQ